MTVTDNTKAGVRAFFPDGMFFPKVAYAPETGAGEGGASGDTASDKDEDTSTDDEVDPNRDIDNPADDMYPDLSNKNKDKDKDKPAEGDDEDEGDKDDDKDEDEDEDDDKDKDKEDDKDVDLDKVPDEKSSYELKMPDGMEIDKGLLDAVTPSLRAKGFTHKEAQELTDKFIEVRTKEIEKANEAWEETVTGWADQTKKDKEIGGKKFEGSMKSAQSALKQFGTPELRAALDNSGMGSHPEVIRLLARVGNAVTDDDVPQGDSDTRKAAPNSNAETAEELYGDTTPTKRS